MQRPFSATRILPVYLSASLALFTFTPASVFARAPCKDISELADMSPDEIVAGLGMEPAILNFKRDAADVPTLNVAIVKARAMQLPKDAGFSDLPYVGFLAEIGVGSLVGGVFAESGPRSASVASDVSYNDMAKSDAVYGAVPRYVTVDRLRQMLDVHGKDITENYREVEANIAAGRPDRRAKPAGTRFFAYANTAQTGYTGQRHAWLGVRFQTKANGPLNDVLIHVSLTSTSPRLQREHLASVGVNLIYASYRYLDQPARFIESLRDGLKPGDLVIDGIEVKGPDLNGFANPLPQQRLVATGRTPVTGLTPAGTTFAPTDLAFRKTVVYAFGEHAPQEPLQGIGVGKSDGPLVMRVVTTTDAAAQDPRVATKIANAQARGETVLLATPKEASLMQLVDLAGGSKAITDGQRLTLGNPNKVYVLSEAGQLVELQNAK